MKRKDFNSVLKSITVHGQLSVMKAAALPTDVRDQMMKHIVSNREPVVTCLLPDDIAQQNSWLNAMGYLYQSFSQKTGLTFRHTCAHVIQ